MPNITSIRTQNIRTSLLPAIQKKVAKADKKKLKADLPKLNTYIRKSDLESIQSHLLTPKKEVDHDFELKSRMLDILMENPSMLRHLDNQPADVCFALLVFNPNVFRYIKDPTDEMILHAVRKNGLNLEFVPEDRKIRQLQIAAFKQTDDAKAFANYDLLANREVRYKPPTRDQEYRNNAMLMVGIEHRSKISDKKIHKGPTRNELALDRVVLDIREEAKSSYVKKKSLFSRVKSFFNKGKG